MISVDFADLKVGAIHDHSNYADTMGMGELIVVLNGVEFRTRHNDYKPKMPSTTSKVYGATEDIPFPEVPKEVRPQIYKYLYLYVFIILMYYMFKFLYVGGDNYCISWCISCLDQNS